MTIYYVDSAAGSNTAPYDTWAKAATTLATIAAIDAAGDTVYVAHTHAESTAGNVGLNWAGTAASPTRIICADKTSGEPPATLATTATVSTSGATAALTPSSNSASYAYFYGISFIAGVGGSANSTLSLGPGGGGQTPSNSYESCSFQIATTGSSAGISFANAGYARLKNCTFKFANAGQGLVQQGGNTLFIQGGSLLAGGTSPTAFLSAGSSNTSFFALVNGFDFSNAASTLNLVNTNSQTPFVEFRNCKLPASWSGSLFASPTTGHFSFLNTDSTGTNYRADLKSSLGEQTSETTLIRTGGANDGTTGLSWKVVTTGTTKYVLPFECIEIVKWNEAIGSPITATIEILHDSATNLKDNEVWVDVQYLGDSSFPISTYITDNPNVIAAGTDQTTSAAAWTTTGMSNPNTQKLEVTFTPQMKGFIHAVVKVAKASYTLYVDPLITIS